MDSPWITSKDRRGREVSKAHYYRTGEADALCGFGGREPRPASRSKPRCKHCVKKTTR